MPDQRDLICGSCPLEECSEQSLWCLFRLFTDPNDAQRAIANTVIPGALPRPYFRKQGEAASDRQGYFAERYRLRKKLQVAEKNRRVA